MSPVTLEPIAGAPRGGPCEPWATVDASEGHPQGDFSGTTYSGLDATLLGDMAITATDLLFQWSGRKFAGECSTTVAVYHTQHACWMPRVWLGADVVRKVTEVRVDEQGNGEVVVLDPALYEIDDYRWLRRRPNPDGSNPGWPLTRYRSIDTPGLEVDFEYGIPPPPSGVLACVELAGELALAKTDPTKCRLPQRTTNYVRAGVTTQVAEAGDFKSLPTVKAFLDAHNQSGQRRRSGVLSPSTMQETVREGTQAAP